MIENPESIVFSNSATLTAFMYGNIELTGRVARDQYARKL